jgi:hypothetical protein
MLRNYYAALHNLLVAISRFGGFIGLFENHWRTGMTLAVIMNDQG